MADEAKKPEIKVGEPAFEGGDRLVFKYPHHPEFEKAFDATTAAEFNFTAAAKAHEGYRQAIGALVQEHGTGAVASAEEAVFRRPTAVTHPQLNHELAEKVKTLAEKHLPEQTKAAIAANAEMERVKYELRRAQSDHMKSPAFKIEEIPGYTAKKRAAIEAAIAKHHEETEKLGASVEAFARKTAATAGNVAEAAAKDAEKIGFLRRTGSRIKKNFAFGQSKGRAAFSTVGTVIGLGAIFDALGRSTCAGADGQREKRSLGLRTAELAGGVVVTGISAFR